MFSPGYARTGGDPRRFLALNVALYDLAGGPPTWIFAEHDGRHLPSSPDALAVGDSLLERSGDGLTLRFDEHTTPFPRVARPRRLQGTVRLRGDLTGAAPPVVLDDQGSHRWWPVQPCADLEVDVPALGLRWRGLGYHDANAGDRPLAASFRRWSWGRFHHGASTLVTYDTEPLVGPPRSVALRLDRGQREILPGFASRSLSTGRWGIPVVAPHDHGAARPRLVQALEDSPFYGRHLVETTLCGERLRGITETLSVERFAAPWVRFLLPFRIRSSP